MVLVLLCAIRFHEPWVGVKARPKAYGNSCSVVIHSAYALYVCGLVGPVVNDESHRWLHHGNRVSDARKSCPQIYLIGSLILL